MASEDRLAILDAMVDGAASPVQASRQLELPLANVAYHVRSLRDAGLLRERGYRQARGAVENLYEVTPLGLRVRVAARTVADAVEQEGRPAKGSRRRVRS